MRWIVGGRAVAKAAASTSQMGRFETEFLATDENLTALAGLSGQWIDRVHARHPPRVITRRLVPLHRDDDTAFGILHSRFHEAWSLRLGTSLEDRPRYTPTTTFETFTFPDGLSPDIPAADYANDPRADAIAGAARRLVELRDRWLNPPERVEWMGEPVSGYPRRPVARNNAAARKLKTRTLTNLYNVRPQ